MEVVPPEIRVESKKARLGWKKMRHSETLEDDFVYHRKDGIWQNVSTLSIIISWRVGEGDIKKVV